MLSLTNFENEHTIIARRKHWIHPFSQAFIVLFLTTFLLTAVFITFSSFQDKRLLISSEILVISCGLGMIAKIIVDWNFHLYVITTKRIIEISHSPILFSRINGIILDQIRCTEIEQRRSGPVKEIFDFGDVIVKYDSTTRSDMFKFHNIPNPDEFVYTLNKIIMPQNSPYQFQPVRRDYAKLTIAN